MEIWKDIVGYEGYYQVSDKGRVRSCDRHVRNGNGKRRRKSALRKLYVNIDGYHTVKLSKSSKTEEKRVGRLVLESFGREPLDWEVCNHIDGVKTNDTPSNLEWCSQSENVKHSYRLGLRTISDKQKRDLSLRSRGENNNLSKLVEKDVIEIRKLYKSGLTQQEISNRFPISRANVSEIVNYKTWKHV